MTPIEEKIPTAVRNEFFYLFARLCMVFATVVGLPSAGYMLSRVINKADEISAKVEKQNLTLQLMAADMKYRFAVINDHEARLRALEKDKFR